MRNMPEVKLGLIAVSRDCFPITLSDRRSQEVVAAAKEQGVEIYRSKTVVESETDMLKAVDDIQAEGVNALVVYLGNFGPESAETIIAQKFAGPVMYVAAAEESQEELLQGRGDAYCGMLNCS